MFSQGGGITQTESRSAKSDVSRSQVSTYIYICIYTYTRPWPWPCRGRGRGQAVAVGRISPQIHPQNVNVFSCCIYKCSRRRMESRRRNQKLMINIVGFFSRYTYALLISSVKQVPHEVVDIRCKDSARAYFFITLRVGQ